MQKWKNLEDGIEFVLYFSHGDADSETIEKVHINLTESEKFEKLFNIFSHLGEGMSRYFESYTEKVAEYISKKTNYSADEIMELIENIVKSDVKFDEHMAQMSYFEVFKYENGTIQKLEL